MLVRQLPPAISQGIAVTAGRLGDRAEALGAIALATQRTSAHLLTLIAERGGFRCRSRRDGLYDRSGGGSGRMKVWVPDKEIAEAMAGVAGADVDVYPGGDDLPGDPARWSSMFRRSTPTPPSRAILARMTNLKILQLQVAGVDTFLPHVPPASCCATAGASTTRAPPSGWSARSSRPSATSRVSRRAARRALGLAHDRRAAPTAPC